VDEVLGQPVGRKRSGTQSVRPDELVHL
jgi:hypothetical protein